MNKISTILKLGAMALVCLSQSVNITAQTTLISPTGDGGFENGATFAANGWTEANAAFNGLNNNWFVGAVSTPSAGANAAYVSNDVAGATYNYLVTDVSTAHFWRDVTFPAGETNIVLTFKWKTFGEASFDYVTVYSMPTSNTPIADSPAGAFQSWLQIPVAYPGAVIHCTPPNLNVQAAYQTQTICLPAAYAGTTRRLVFMWSNDPSVGTQPPGSIDEISLVSSLPPSAPANSPTALILTPISITQIDGSFTAAGGAPDGYLTVRYPAGSTPTNPVNGTSYVAGASLGLGKVVQSSAATTFSATGLSPSTAYDFYIYSYNSAPCAGGPLYKTTAPLFGTASTLACTGIPAGTYSVGPTGTYASLTAVAAALSNGTAGPVIFELQAAYLSTVETFPITFLGHPCPQNVTIRPEAGAVALSVTGADATGTINFNGGDNITFDGRAGGVGPSQLTIENTALTGYAIQFINNATLNTIKHCTVKGVNTGTASGVIAFSTSTGLEFGNSNNTIDNCDIRDGATTPTNLVYATGTTTTYNSQNNNNTISNSLLHDWFNASSTTAGAAINVVTGCSDWTITNNSFYQSVSRTFTMVSATDQGAIHINSTVFGFNFTITNNFVGGSAPLCAGAPWTYTGGATGTPTPRLIRISTSIGSPFNTISNNTIRNIAITSSSTSTAHSLISHLNGNININNNTIGSQSALNDITFTLASTSTAPFFLPISTGTGASVSMINITNNNFGGINVNTSSTGAVSFRVIYAQPPALSKVTVSGNTIGGTVANSIRQQTGGAAAGNGLLSAIMILNPTIGDVVTNNIIRNLTQDNALAGGSLSGINVQASGGQHTITGNTISDLTTNGTNIAINNAASVVGITMTGSTIGGSNISNNTVYNLTNTNATVAGFIQGMYFGTGLFPQQNTIISKNFVHSINLASPLGGMAGINIPNTGNARIFNNMVRLGVDAGGASITTSLQINGILKASTGAVSVFANTVFIGGTGVASGLVNTFAFRRTASPLVGNDTIMNNIFYNARSNASGTGKHYATGLNAGTTLGSDFNDLYVDGVGGVLGLFVAADQATLAAWQIAANQDWNSASGDPMLINPNGTSATVDLHIQAASATVVEQGGYNLPPNTQDFDMQVRSGLTPVDIGADAGNFLLLDKTPPAIYYNTLNYTCSTGDRTVTGVNITDATGVPLAGALRPRIYYRKNAGAYFSQPGTNTGGTTFNSTWDFTIVAADMGGLVAGDVVSYYIIAQDNAVPINIGSNAGGAIATDVNTVTTHPVTPGTYTINATSLSGTYTVGVGGAYTTLTAAVTAYNTACITGPVLFSLIDANYPTETFPIQINANPYASSVNTLTIKPAAGVVATITGTTTIAPQGIIVLNGADWVTIDGSNGAVPNTICPPSAASRDLTITNLSTSTVSAVIWLQSIVTTNPVNGATNNTIRNINLVGNGNTQTLFGIGMGSATTGISTASLGAGNNNNSFINNNISKTQYGIYTQGANLSNKNTGNVINQNLVNTVAPNNCRQGGIWVGFEDGIQINGNNISELTFTSDLFGIALGMNAISTTIFTGNEVTNATVTHNKIGTVINTGTFAAAGITIANALSGTNTIANNMISGVFANGTSTDFAVGIYAGGGPGSTTRIYYNSVSLSRSDLLTGTSPNYALAIGGVQPIVDVRNNILSSTGNNGTGRNIAIGLAYTGTTGNYQNLTSNNNDLWASGTNSAVGVTGSLATNAGIFRTTLAEWQNETGRDGNSFSVLPNFVSNSNLDLLSGSNHCLDGGGTPIIITNDIYCDPRNATTPDIGADEFTNPLLTLTTTGNNLCAGTPVTLTATGGGTYLWAPGGATTSSIMVSPMVNTTYTVTVTNGTCTDVMSITITVLTAPFLTSMNIPPSSCTAADGSIDLMVTPAGQTLNYDWADVPGTNNTEDRAGLPPAFYSVTVTNTTTGCTRSLTIDLTAGCVCPTIPNLSATPANAVCAGLNFTLTSTMLTGMGNIYGIVFKSFPGPVGNPYAGGTILATVTNANLTSNKTVATAVVSIATPGNYNIYAILDQLPGDPTCRPAATFLPAYVVNAVPVAATTVMETSGLANNDGITCAGAPVTITATPASGVTYLWTPGGATTASITVSPVLTTTYTVTVTNAAGCTGTASRTITVNPLPTVFNVTGGGVRCTTDNEGFSILLSGSQTGVNYQL
ncbi:MAG: beta strand repeat-containing protein, partial [Saprospiraceae bacterium]